MKKNKDLVITCSIIALSILTIDIILAMIAGMYTLCCVLVIVFAISSIALVIYKSHKHQKPKKSVITNIEDTIVLKLEDLDCIKLTPIRTVEEIALKDDESIKEDLKIQRENHITREKIEEELSKTIFINDLKEKMKLYELEHEKIREQEEQQELEEFKELLKSKKND